MSICPNYKSSFDFRSILEHEINLTFLIRKITWLHLKLAAKLLKNEILCQRPFEMLIAFQQNGTVVTPCHMFEQTRVKKKKLKLSYFS